MINTILAIDDDIRNLKIIQRFLSDTDYEIITASNGVEGLDKLKQNKDKIKLILLDRMMPQMDGIEFMKILKTEPDLFKIPVIMQTAAAETNQIIEGIDAGVYYYLAKPYSEEVLLSLINAAITNRASKENLITEINKYRRIAKMITSGEFRIQTLHDSTEITSYLANFFPNPERVAYGISELLINAIEHGNLGIDYEGKTHLLNEGKLNDEIERLLTLKENLDKFVIITYKNHGTHITLTIKDQGQGFNWQKYLTIDPERLTHNHGRGIAIACQASFDNLEYEGNGNTVTVRINVL